MKVSVCLTVFNEENSIMNLLKSLKRQTKKPDEIIIVDGGSKDKTVEIIKNYKKKCKGIKLIIKQCSRAEGRNISVELAKNDIIVMTDAGCVAKNNWLENITKPFDIKSTEVVAGFYEMVADNDLQKAMSFYLGVVPEKFNGNFLPSTRSVAFRKSVWKKVGRFPEEITGTAEDTVFNYKLLKAGVKITRVKDALVEWSMPDNLNEFAKKIYFYARGDARSGIWLFPTKGLMSHNIKSLFKLIRYILGFIVLLFSLNNRIFLLIFVILIIAYSFWSFIKIYRIFNDYKVSLWGVLLQFVNDIAAMYGFMSGLLSFK